MKDHPTLLTPQENKAGWQLLFDGMTTQGWHSYGKNYAGTAWKVVDGLLFLDTSVKENGRTKDGGDLVTDGEFDNFHLKLDWKISAGGNSGIIFFVHEDASQYTYSWHTGLEMQVLDNAAHRDAGILKHRAGDLYDLIASSVDAVKPAGEWNHVEIIASDNKLDFFLNDANIVSTILWDEQWQKLVADSKFKNFPGFSRFRKGKIALQDHGDDVWYKDLKIKRL